MRFEIRSFVPWLAGLALLSFVEGAEARQGNLIVRQNPRPLGSATLDLATGTVTRGTVAHDKVGTTIADFSNLDVAGFSGVDSGAGFCEWFEAGTKGFAASSDLMSDIVFAYCSAELSASSGGPGGSVTLGFYEGYVAGGGAPTTVVAKFTLTGLPANTASSSFFGGFRCFFLRVLFADLVPFADGPIGYSWHFIDLGTTGVLAGTWPFLACVQSCSGHGPDGLGMISTIDEYCPPGTLRLPVPPSSFAIYVSIAMEIREAADLTATATPYLGQNINRDVLTAMPIVVGQPWNVSLHVPGGTHPHGAAPSAAMVAKVRRVVVNGPNVVSPVGGRLTEVLINGPLLATFAGVHAPTGGGQRDGAFPPQTVPAALDLVNVSWAVQATVLGGGFADLSTAYFGVTGTR